MEHFEARHGRVPTLDEENAWISDLPDSRLNDITINASGFFEFAARRYMADEIEEERASAVDASILKQVERATSFKSTFWPNIFTGLVASLFFSCLVIGMGIIYAHDPSPIALYKALVTPSQHSAPAP